MPHRNRMLTPAQKQEIHTKIRRDTNFDILVASLFATYPRANHVQLVTFIHEEYVDRGWFEYAQRSVAKLGRDFTPAELETIIENALGGGLMHSAVMTLAKRGRKITDAEIKISMLRNTRAAIEGLSTIICRYERKAALHDVVVHLVDKEDYSSAKLLTDYILGKPYVSVNGSSKKPEKKPRRRKRGLNHLATVATP